MTRAHAAQHRRLHADRGAGRDRADGRDPRGARDRDGAMAAELEPRLRRVQRAELLALGLERMVADLAAAEFITAGAASRAAGVRRHRALGDVRAHRARAQHAARPGDRAHRRDRRRAGPDAGAHARAVRADRPRRRRRCSPRSADPVVLLRAPYRVTFSYAGADRVWRNAWRGAGSCRKAVRVQLRDAATDRTLAVSTATLVHADMPADCVLAEVIADCLNRRGRGRNRRCRRLSPMLRIPRQTLRALAQPAAATASSSSRCCGSWPRSRRWRRSSPSTSSTPRSRFAVHDERAAGRERWRAPRSNSAVYQVSAATRSGRRRAAASRSASATPASRRSFARRRRASTSSGAQGAARRPVRRRSARARERSRLPMPTASSRWRAPPGRRARRTTKHPTIAPPGLLYAPRGAPFPHVAELWLVLGHPRG